MSEPAPTRGQLRIKAAAALVSGALAVSCVLLDWKDPSGNERPNVFSGVRPAVKRAVTWLWDGASGDNTKGS